MKSSSELAASNKAHEKHIQDLNKNPRKLDEDELQWLVWLRKTLWPFLTESSWWNTTINLQLGLGEAPLPSSPSQAQRCVHGPSRWRLTERCALARKQAEEAQDKTEAEQANGEAENSKQENEAVSIAAYVLNDAAKATKEVVPASNTTENVVNEEFCPIESIRQLFLPDF